VQANWRLEIVVGEMFFIYYFVLVSAAKLRQKTNTFQTFSATNAPPVCPVTAPPLFLSCEIQHYSNGMKKEQDQGVLWHSQG
jgi:hypothetical protein